jgi:hypothetical protein
LIDFKEIEISVFYAMDAPGLLSGETEKEGYR